MLIKKLELRKNIGGNFNENINVNMGISTKNSWRNC